MYIHAYIKYMYMYNVLTYKYINMTVYIHIYTKK